jgi:hypothetical protein
LVKFKPFHPRRELTKEEGEEGGKKIVHTPAQNLHE